jgi:hypothetical protein
VTTVIIEISLSAVGAVVEHRIPQVEARIPRVWIIADSQSFCWLEKQGLAFFGRKDKQPIFHWLFFVIHRSLAFATRPVHTPMSI